MEWHCSGSGLYKPPADGAGHLIVGWGAEMWKPEHCRAAERRGLRYPSDETDGEWALVEPMILPASPASARREVNVREVLNANFYVLSKGCQWQELPKDLPPKSTAHSYFTPWDWDSGLAAKSEKEKSRKSEGSRASRTENDDTRAEGEYSTSVTLTTQTV
jgi:transposase